LFFGTVAIAAGIEGVFMNSHLTRVTFMGDIAAPMQFGILNPLVLVLILKHYEVLSGIFQRLDDIVIVIEQRKRAQIVRAAQTRYSQKWILGVACFFAVIGTIIFFVIRRHTDRPYYFLGDSISVSGLLTGIWGTLITYVILTWAIKSALTVQTFRSLFSYPIRYRILDLDGRAGLGEVGRYFTFFALIILTAGLTLSFFLVPLRSFWRVHTFEGIKYALYGVPYLAPFLIAGISVYCLLLYEVHSKMVAAKEEVLSRIASDVDQTNSKAIVDFHSLAKELPDWPTPRIAISTVISSVVGSIIAPVLVDKAKDFLGRVF
jgi:hypothetical protein